MGISLCYGGRRRPDSNIFRRLEQCLCETGIITLMVNMNAGGRRTIRTPPTNADVVIAATEPWRSPRDFARDFGTLPTKGPRNAS